jgi:hypothetical protein
MTIEDISHPNYSEERLKNALELGKEAPIWITELLIDCPCYEECKECKRNNILETYVKNSLGEIFTRINIIKELGTVKLIIGGGDPTTHKQICEIINYAHEVGFKDIILKTPANVPIDYMEDLIDCGITELRIKVNAAELTTNQILNIKMFNESIPIYIRYNHLTGIKDLNKTIEKWNFIHEDIKFTDLLFTCPNIDIQSKLKTSNLEKFKYLQFRVKYDEEMGKERVNEDSPTFCPVIADSIIVDTNGMIHECPAQKYSNRKSYADIYDPNLRQNIFKHSRTFDPTEEPSCINRCSLANVAYNKIYKENL